MKAGDANASALSISADGKRIVSASKDVTVKVWTAAVDRDAV